MILEDPIIRKSREKIRNAINQKFQDEGTRIYLNRNMYEILDTICNFFNHDSQEIYSLSRKHRDQILEILNRKGIHLHSREYHSLRGVITTILKERYRSYLPFDSEVNLPERVSAFDIYGEYTFDDLICLNDTDYRHLKSELRIFSSKNCSTLLEIVSEASMSSKEIYPRYLSYDYLPHTKSLRRYQRLRMLDDIMSNTKVPLSIRQIDDKMYHLANTIGIDFSSLWKINSFESWDKTDYMRDSKSIYKQDFLSLAELIAPSEKSKTKRYDVYRFDGEGGRCYRIPGMSAFKLVIPSSLAMNIYQEITDSGIDLDSDIYWKYPLIYAITSYGKLKENEENLDYAYSSNKTHEMKYYKTGSIFDYEKDFDEDNNIWKE